MARIDSILGIVVSQGANELRVGTDREPKMLAYGIAKRLSIPQTPANTLRELLGEIMTAEREEAMRGRGRVELAYEAGALGPFKVTLTARSDGGFDAVFVRDGSKAGKAGSAEAPVKLSPAVMSVAAPASGVLPTAVPSSLSDVGNGDSAARDQPSPALPVSHPVAPVAVTIAVTPALAQLVERAVSLRASDLHLCDGEAAVARVDGRLMRLDEEHPIEVAKVLPLDEHSLYRIRAGESVDLALEIEGAGRIRVHVFRTDDRLASAIRMLPKGAPSLSSLHLPVPLDDLIDLPQGLVIVCGATGSGKSTTLAALAQEAVHRRSVVLTTLEDPIEYVITPPPSSLVRRRQVRRDVRDFASGLRDALREDPDVLLVGEMRDPETIGLALTAAETGHLVLASLHSRSAASAIERIVDAYPPERQQQIRVQLADSLRAVIAQRLLPRARGEGRLPVLEVLRVNYAVANIIRDAKTAQIATVIQSGKKEGMMSLERCLADKVLAGEIRADDAKGAANDPASLARYLAG